LIQEIDRPDLVVCRRLLRCYLGASPAEEQGFCGSVVSSADFSRISAGTAAAPDFAGEAR